MALSFPGFSWLWLGRKEKEQVTKNSIEECPLSLNRKVKRKWKSREEGSRRIDREYDVVLAPSDGVCLSGQNPRTLTGLLGGWSRTPPISRVMIRLMTALLFLSLVIGMTLKK